MKFDIEFIQYVGVDIDQKRVVLRVSGFSTRADAIQYGNTHLPKEANGFEVLQNGIRKAHILFKEREHDAAGS